MATSPFLSEDDLHRFRTKPCRRVRFNGCVFGENRCQYSHNEYWPRRCPFYLTNRHALRYLPDMCPLVTLDVGGNLIRNTCDRGGNCPYAHSREEEEYHPLRYKTTICSDFRKDRCERYYCPWVHGLAEQRENLKTYKLPYTRGIDLPRHDNVIVEQLDNVRSGKSVSNEIDANIDGRSSESLHSVQGSGASSSDSLHFCLPSTSDTDKILKESIDSFFQDAGMKTIESFCRGESGIEGLAMWQIHEYYSMPKPENWLNNGIPVGSSTGNKFTSKPPSNKLSINREDITSAATPRSLKHHSQPAATDTVDSHSLFYGDRGTLWMDAPRQEANSVDMSTKRRMDEINLVGLEGGLLKAVQVKHFLQRLLSFMKDHPQVSNCGSNINSSNEDHSREYNTISKGYSSEKEEHEMWNEAHSLAHCLVGEIIKNQMPASPACLV